MKPRIEVYPDRSGEWRWRLWSANNRIVAESGESYTRKRDCERAIRSTDRAWMDAYAAKVLD